MDLDNFKPRERFSRVAGDYSRYRPGYPREIIDTLVREYGLTASSVITDIGSGTGNLTKLFLDLGARVYAVEPNAEMRVEAETRFSGISGFVSVDGAAESTTLPDGVADFITAGQAFHWFDERKSRVEFQRILKKGGHVAIVWNTRDNTKPFMKDYDGIVTRYCPDMKKIDRIVYSAAERALVLEEFFDKRAIQKHTFGYMQVFDFEELAGRLRSSSYSPEEGSDTYKALIAELRVLFDRFSVNGKIPFEYLTELFVSELS